jgi:histidinol-phosphate/aromatic aminotransferase/cobyric acid decarboxylase-like protein
MLDDSRWLANALAEVPGLDLLRNEHVHFQYAWTDQATRIADVFADHKIGVRSLGAAHGVHPGALRIVAPRPEERAAFAAGLDAATAELGSP